MTKIRDRALMGAFTIAMILTYLGLWLLNFLAHGGA